MEPLVLKRYFPPNKYDTAPCGTKCIVIGETETPETYIQKSTDEENPNWVQINEEAKD
jgi:hypothetical protein